LSTKRVGSKLVKESRIRKKQLKHAMGGKKGAFLAEV